MQLKTYCAIGQLKENNGYRAYYESDTEEDEEYGDELVSSEYSEEYGSDDELYREEEEDLGGSVPTKLVWEEDVQGIKCFLTREEARQIKLQHYKNHTDIPNLPYYANGLEKECKLTRNNGEYYQFCTMTRAKPSIVHFKMRNLVWSTSKHDVYLTSNYSVVHLSSLRNKKTQVLKVSDVPNEEEEEEEEEEEGDHVGGVNTKTEISTIAVRGNLLIAGGVEGQIICKYINRPAVSFCTWAAIDTTTNAIDIYDSASGAVHFRAAVGDWGLLDLDLERFQEVKSFSFDLPVNHSSLSPDGKRIAVVGDSTTCLLVDSQTGKTIAPLYGHRDYSFASAWHPNNHTFATGNQDKTCRVWDCRNLSKHVAVLKANMGAVRCIRFTSDGQFMAMAESADYVHVSREQEMDFFGEISGISFSPDDESLFIGVSHERRMVVSFNIVDARDTLFLDALI